MQSFKQKMLNFCSIETKVLEFKIGVFHPEPQTELLYLAGTLLTDRTYNNNALMDVMKKAWRPKNTLVSHEWGKNLFLFQFEDKRDVDWVF